MEGEPLFLTCGSKDHRASVSVHPKDKVPRELFVNPKKPGTLFKTCVDCLAYDTKKKKRHRGERAAKRDAMDPNDESKFACAACGTVRTKEHCKTCSEQDAAKYVKKKANLQRVMWEAMLEMGCSCERCRMTFVRRDDGSHGFIVKNWFENTKREDIEFRNLEFDHLTEEEQIRIKGKYYGPKKKGVASYQGYASMKAESRKCQLLCLHCHRLVTKERRLLQKVKRSSARPKTTAKKAYLKQEKLRIGKCSLCGCLCTEANLSSFEFDHLDPSTKVDSVSYIASSSKACHSMPVLQAEIPKCRLLCVFCHRIHSGNQTSERWAKKRVKVAPKEEEESMKEKTQ